MKIVIAGGPRTGKSTFATRLNKELNIPIVSTDNYIACGWSEAPHEIINDIKDLDNYILEGVNCGRVIRKLNEKGLDICFDKVYYLGEPVVKYEKKGQESLAKGCKTVWLDVIPILDALEIDVIYGFGD